MSFITLTNMEGNPILVNVSTIEYITSHKKKDGEETCWVSTGHSEIFVRESYETVKNILRRTL